MKKWNLWIALVLIISLLTACGDAGNYVKNTYPLISADGQGSNLSKVYLVEGKKVPVVADELSTQEPPKETSKASDEQMFLLYADKVINVQKDPQNAENSLVEVNTVQYAKDHYDSSFLEGYLTASILHSVFDDDWLKSKPKSEYRGYTKTPTYSAGGGTVKKPSATAAPEKEKAPTTSNRSGSFKTSKGISGTNTGSVSAGSSSTTRKNDGSVPNKVSKPSAKKPTTSSKSGSFKRRK